MAPTKATGTAGRRTRGAPAPAKPTRQAAARSPAGPTRTRGAGRGALRIALTGTPGVGKTTVAAALRRAGHQVVDVKAWAAEVGAVAGHDAADEADAIDVEVLRAAMPKGSPGRRWAQGGPPTGAARAAGAPGAAGPAEAAEALPGSVIYEGHLAHLLPVDVAWVIRCDPRVLAPRLQARGYRPGKVRENLEAEALDIILQEALDSGARVIQRDGTARSVPELVEAFAKATLRAAGPSDVEPVDWSDQLPIEMPAPPKAPGAPRRKRGA